MLASHAERWRLAILDLLSGVNLSQPDELPQLVRAASAPVADGVTLYLVDHEQQMLREFTGTLEKGTERQVEGSVAGLAFQRGQVQPEPNDPAVLWVPLLDSTERLGVLRVVVRDPPAPSRRADQESLVQFANLVGHLIAAKQPYGDRLHQARSSESMSVAAVLLRQLLPPSTLTSDRMVISASLHPAYAVGGDAFDYSVDGDIAHIAILDGAGHGLTAGLSVAVALSAMRAERRKGEGLVSMARTADTHLDAQFDDSQFVTAALLRLDLGSGLLRFVNAGHPSPIVFTPNGGTVALEGGRRTPLGIPTARVSLGRYHLQIGDKLLMYTDGAVECRNREGEFFTLERLVDVSRRQLSGDLTPPEVVRRINQAVVDFHDGPPEDDSTILLLEWSPTAARETLP